MIKKEVPTKEMDKQDAVANEEDIYLSNEQHVPQKERPPYVLIFILICALLSVFWKAYMASTYEEEQGAVISAPTQSQ